jgi:hypothetical protein
VALADNDLALLSARFGVARFGASRFGFVPCPEDVEGVGHDEPGEYIWKEEHPPVTEWTLVNEDCVCQNLCTLALGTITLDDPTPVEDVDVTASVTLSGVIGQVSGLARINWGDGRHDESAEDPLSDGVLQFTGHYHVPGDYTITITVTDERGCVVVNTLDVVVASPSTLDVIYIMTPALAWNSTDPITFTPTVTPGVPPYTYDWDFGDGSPHSTDEIPIHIYGSPGDGGTYTCTLTVTDASLAVDTYDLTFDIAGV